MFAARYFGKRYFPGAYWPPVGEAPPVEPPSGGSRRRPRPLLGRRRPVPLDDEELMFWL